MKIGVAQIRPAKGDIEKNIQSHIRLIDKAVSLGARVIVFPELSLTGYEPTLASELSCTQDDERLYVFQDNSDKEIITICVGLPTKNNSGSHISLFVFHQ